MLFLYLLSLVKMVYFFSVFSRLFVVVLSFTLAANGSTVWLVADFKAHSYQVTTTLDAG